LFYSERLWCIHGILESWSDGVRAKRIQETGVRRVEFRRTIQLGTSSDFILSPVF